MASRSCRAKPDQADAVPNSRRSRRGEPRLHVSARPRADDDRRHEARARAGPSSSSPPSARMYEARRAAVRRSSPNDWLRPATRAWSPGGPGERRSADRGRAADDPRTGRLHPVAPGRASRRGADRRSASPDRGPIRHDRRRSDRLLLQALLDRHPESARSGRSPICPCSTSSWVDIQDDEIIRSRSAQPSGDHGRDEATQAQRPPTGVARRDERGRHLDPAFASGNVTFRDGLGLLEVADAIRVRGIQRSQGSLVVEDEHLDELSELATTRRRRATSGPTLDSTAPSARSGHHAEERRAGEHPPRRARDPRNVELRELAAITLACWAWQAALEKNRSRWSACGR